MAETNRSSLIERALSVRDRLERNGWREEASVIDLLVEELTAATPEDADRFYSMAQAAALIGVGESVIREWIDRGILNGRLADDQLMISASAIRSYQALAEASHDLEPLPSRQSLVKLVRLGRRPVRWPPTL